MDNNVHQDPCLRSLSMELMPDMVKLFCSYTADFCAKGCFLPSQFTVQDWDSSWCSLWYHHRSWKQACFREHSGHSPVVNSKFIFKNLHFFSLVRLPSFLACYISIILRVQTSSCAAHCLEFSAERNPYIFYDALLMPCKFHWCTGLRLPVLKPLQEVYSRRVIEDDGERQLVEVNQAAIWRFLCFSGTFSVCVLVDQDRRTHTVSTAVNVDLSFLYATISQFPQVSERV